MSAADPSKAPLQSLWVFGYGSLIWRPDMPYVEARTARLHGWMRRFWQGSHDHRGVPEAPGRVVTLLPSADDYCDGVAYLVEGHTAQNVLSQLDYREKNGYARHDVVLHDHNGTTFRALVYIATEENFAYLGPAEVNEIVDQIACSHGPSGANSEYLLALAEALRQLRADDAHVFELERLLLARRSTRAALPHNSP
jgi:glutathione-specific gamma-glutamylcyclotransferase